MIKEKLRSHLDKLTIIYRVISKLDDTIGIIRSLHFLTNIYKKYKVLQHQPLKFVITFDNVYQFCLLVSRLTACFENRDYNLV